MWARWLIRGSRATRRFAYFRRRFAFYISHSLRLSPTHTHNSPTFKPRGRWPKYGYVLLLVARDTPHTQKLRIRDDFSWSSTRYPNAVLTVSQKCNKEIKMPIVNRIHRWNGKLEQIFNCPLGACWLNRLWNFCLIRSNLPFNDNPWVAERKWKYLCGIDCNLETK